MVRKVIKKCSGHPFALKDLYSFTEHQIAGNWRAGNIDSDPCFADPAPVVTIT